MDEFKKKHKQLWQFGEYLFSGGAYFITGYILFAILWTGLGWSLWWASITSNVFGWTINYLMQRYWVFNSGELKKHRTEVTNRYAAITLVDFVLNYFILYGLKQFGLTPYIGQFVSAGFFTGWNYVWYRFWVFPDRADDLIFKATWSRIFVHRAHGHSAYIHHG